MSRFYLSTTNSRGSKVTAAGRASGQTAHLRGWRAGIEVQAQQLASNPQADVFVVYATAGSGDQYGDNRQCIGSVRETEHGRVFRLDPRMASKLGLDYMADHDVKLDQD
jgi:hypothetical protein